MPRVLALLACSAGACFFSPERPMDGMATGDAGRDDGNGGAKDGPLEDATPPGSCASEYSDDFADGVAEPCSTWGTQYVDVGATLVRVDQALQVRFATGGGSGGCYVHEHVITNGVSIRVDLAYIDTSTEHFKLALTAPMEAAATSTIIVGHDGSGRVIQLERAGGVMMAPMPYTGPTETVFRIVPTAIAVVASYLDANSTWIEIAQDPRDARGLGSAMFQAKGLTGLEAEFDDLNLYTCPL